MPFSGYPAWSLAQTVTLQTVGVDLAAYRDVLSAGIVEPIILGQCSHPCNITLNVSNTQLLKQRHEKTSADKSRLLGASRQQKHFEN